MPEKDIITLTFQKRGAFDLPVLYKKIVQYLKGKGFTVVESEVAHKGKEQVMKWKSSLKATGYVKYKIEVATKAWDLKPAELPDKRKVSAGVVSYGITAKMQSNYMTEEELKEAKKKLTPFRAFVVKVQDALFLKPELKKRKLELIEITKALHKVMKDTLQALHPD